jgi:thiol-disulfide isomerase/thioredoxin
MEANMLPRQDVTRELARDRRVRTAVVVLIGAAAVAFSAAVRAHTQSGAGDHSQAPFPKPTATMPSGCVREVSDYQAARQKDIPPSDPQGANAARTAMLQQISQAARAMAQTCAAQFDVATVPATELVSLAMLYASGNNASGALSAIDRALSLKTVPPADRVAMLSAAVRVLRAIPPPTPTRDGRQQQLYPRLEQIADELDANPAATIEVKLGAHASILGSYRGDDLDAGIIKHATWLIDASKTLSPAQLTTSGPSFVEAYVDLSEAWAGQGMTEKALDLLRAGKKSLADTPRSASSFDPEISRLELVGTPARAITAPRWLNAPADLRTLPMAGQVTLLEFTAHWCGPCRESYPGVNRLRERFAAQGFRVVMVTRYWGYFSKDGLLERPLAAEVELERDRAYFAGYHLDVPVAIGDQVTLQRVGNDFQWDPEPDPNDTNYRVTGIPQIQIIDRAGVIRRILVGYDNANEPKLAAFIDELLKER